MAEPAAWRLSRCSRCSSARVAASRATAYRTAADRFEAALAATEEDAEPAAGRGWLLVRAAILNRFFNALSALPAFKSVSMPKQPLVSAADSGSAVAKVANSPTQASKVSFEIVCELP